jgi:hypothetical protein
MYLVCVLRMNPLVTLDPNIIPIPHLLHDSLFHKIFCTPDTSPALVEIQKGSL